VARLTHAQIVQNLIWINVLALPARYEYSRVT
jgi:hypothetical protein